MRPKDSKGNKACCANCTHLTAGSRCQLLNVFTNPDDLCSHPTENGTLWEELYVPPDCLKVLEEDWEPGRCAKGVSPGSFMLLVELVRHLQKENSLMIEEMSDTLRSLVRDPKETP